MTCRVCGGRIEPAVTALPVKIGPHSIVIVKKLPVYECRECGKYPIEDRVMGKVEAILGNADKAAELALSGTPPSSGEPKGGLDIDWGY